MPALSSAFSKFCKFIEDQWRGTVRNLALMGGLLWGGMPMVRDLQREFAGEDRQRLLQERMGGVNPRDELNRLNELARKKKEDAEAELRNRTLATPVGGGSRGTFNASAAFGLLGPGKDPVAAAVESMADQQRRLLEEANRILRNIAEGVDGFTFV
jgi:hypothetical protein